MQKVVLLLAMFTCIMSVNAQVSDSKIIAEIKKQEPATITVKLENSITEKEYEDFYHEVHQIAQIARNAFDEENFIASVNEWRKIFGDEFPSAIEDKSSGLGGFTTRNEKSDNIPRGRFA